MRMNIYKAGHNRITRGVYKILSVFVDGRVNRLFIPVPIIGHIARLGYRCDNAVLNFDVPDKINIVRGIDYSAVFDDHLMPLFLILNILKLGYIFPVGFNLAAVKIFNVKHYIAFGSEVYFSLA